MCVNSNVTQFDYLGQGEDDGNLMLYAALSYGISSFIYIFHIYLHVHNVTYNIYNLPAAFMFNFFMQTWMFMFILVLCTNL